MSERLWSYRELKHLVINEQMRPEELAVELNRMFHEGVDVRSAVDVNSIRSKGTILDW